MAHPGISPLLLHVCCAPCCGGIVATLLDEGTEFTLYFYNPNIYPKTEYLRRKDEVLRFAQRSGIPCVDEDNTPDLWLERVKGLEDAPERGLRCNACFDMRLERAARYAHENGFTALATTNGISRWKDPAQVGRALVHAAAPYPSLVCLNRDWRQQGGTQRMHTVAKTENFYRQTYCGCRYSMKNANNRKTL